MHRRFLDSQVTLAFGTDYPVERITPFRAFYASICRPHRAQFPRLKNLFRAGSQEITLEDDEISYVRTGLCRIEIALLSWARSMALV